MNATIRISPLTKSCAIAVSSPAESNFGRKAEPRSRAPASSELSEIEAILSLYRPRSGAQIKFVAR
jgi:hypothetical protein